MKKLKAVIDRLLRPRSKKAFIHSLADDATVLDIGCGNGSDMLFRTLAPHARYIGIDISPPRSGFQGDEYIESSPTQFNAAVSEQIARADTVISAHNLEHCNDYKELVEIIAKASHLKRMFLSFPSVASLHTPNSRYGTLNFNQDPTHNTIPELDFILSSLERQGWKTDFVAASYKPFIPYLIGMVWSPVFMLTRIESPLYGTYSFYGFESVIWATR